MRENSSLFYWKTEHGFTGWGCLEFKGPLISTRLVQLIMDQIYEGALRVR